MSGGADRGQGERGADMDGWAGTMQKRGGRTDEQTGGEKRTGSG